MQIGKNSVVTMDYTLTDPQGQVLDSSKGREPLAYIHGSGAIIPGLENALTGKNAGESLKVNVAPKDGYGERDANMVQVVPRSAFQNVPSVEVGMQFQAQGPNGPRVVRVVKVEGENVTVDANHALAGIPLTFDVTIKNVRAATSEELAHGHVHGPGGHHH